MVRIALSAPVGGEAAWRHDDASGIFRCGAKPTQSYTTLYRAVAIGKRSTRRRELETPDPETLAKDW